MADALDALLSRYGGAPVPASAPAGGSDPLDALATKYQGNAAPELAAPPTSGVTEVPKGGVPREVPAPEMSVGEDVVRSAATGLAEGVIGIQGLPGDAESLVQKGARFVLDQLGYTPEKLKEMGIPEDRIALLMNPPSALPTTQGITDTVQGVTGKFHEPQTTAGEYARTVGQFAPAAIGGEGGLIRKGAQAVMPALVSETAGQVARQVAPQYEPAARVAGAIAGGPAGSRAVAKKILPATEEITAKAQQAYKRADNAGLVVKGNSFRGLVAGLVPRLKREGIDPTIHPKVTAAVKRLADTADANAPVSLQEFDTLRRVVGAAAKSTDADERRIATIIIDRMDDYLDRLGRNDVQAGNWREASGALKEARTLWRQSRKAETIDGILERVGLKEGQFSVSGKENAIRTEFRNLATRMTRDKRVRNQFTKEEQKLIKQLGNMGSAVNILRNLGKLAPRSQLMLGAGVAGGGVAYGTGDPTASAVTGVAYGVGEAARLAALGLTKRKLGQLQTAVRGGQAAPRPPINALQIEAATLPVRPDQ